MIEPLERAFEGREAFHQALIQVLEGSRRSIFAMDPNFEAWPLAGAPACTALRRALLRGAKLRMVVGDTGWLARRAERFMVLRREFSASIEIRMPPESLRPVESLLSADGHQLVRKAHGDSRVGNLSIGIPATVDAHKARLESLWDESSDCLPATTLGL